MKDFRTYIKENNDPVDFFKDKYFPYSTKEEMLDIAKKIHEMGFRTYSKLSEMTYLDYKYFYYEPSEKCFCRSQDKERMEKSIASNINDIDKKYKRIENPDDPYGEEDWGYEKIGESKDNIINLVDEILKFDNFKDFIKHISSLVIGNRISIYDLKREDDKYHVIKGAHGSSGTDITPIKVVAGQAPYDIVKKAAENFCGKQISISVIDIHYRGNDTILYITDKIVIKKVSRTHSDIDPYGEENWEEDHVEDILNERLVITDKKIGSEEILNKGLPVLDDFIGWVHVSPLPNHNMHATKFYIEKNRNNPNPNTLWIVYDKYQYLPDLSINTNSYPDEDMDCDLNKNFYLAKVEEMEGKRIFTPDDPYGEEDWGWEVKENKFESGYFVIRIHSLNEYNELMRLLEEDGHMWSNGRYPTLGTTLYSDRMQVIWVEYRLSWSDYNYYETHNGHNFPCIEFKDFTEERMKKYKRIERPDLDPYGEEDWGREEIIKESLANRYVFSLSSAFDDYLKTIFKQKSDSDMILYQGFEDYLNELLLNKVVQFSGRIKDAHQFQFKDYEIEIKNIFVEKDGPTASSVNFTDDNGVVYHTHCGKVVRVIFPGYLQRREELYKKTREIDPYGEEQWEDEILDSRLDEAYASSGKKYKIGDVVIYKWKNLTNKLEDIGKIVDIFYNSRDDMYGYLVKFNRPQKYCHTGFSGYMSDSEEIREVNYKSKEDDCRWAENKHLSLAAEADIEEYSYRSKQREEKEKRLKSLHKEDDPYGEEIWERKGHGGHRRRGKENKAKELYLRDISSSFIGWPYKDKPELYLKLGKVRNSWREEIGDYMVEFEDVNGRIHKSRIRSIDIRFRTSGKRINPIISGVSVIFQEKGDKISTYRYAWGSNVEIKLPQTIKIYEPQRFFSDIDPYGEEDWDD